MMQTMIPGDAADFFPPTYRASRERLLETTRALSARTSVLIDSRALPEKGPAGETLALDWVMFGARRPKHVFVISSGTHGVEGFTGAAVQHALAEHVLPWLQLGGDTAIVLQHANNPYGFAWLRRVNENNVDLNRNFRPAYDPLQCSPDYEALLDALNPPDLDPSNEAGRRARIDAFIAEHGLPRYQAAVSEGQYKYPGGLQFGGHEQQCSVGHLHALVGEHLAAAQTVLWLDFHTGLGESGACELITGWTADSAPYRFAQQVWAGAVRSASSGESLSPNLNGVMDRGLLPMLSADCRAAMVFPEYGTHPVPRVLAAMRSDNWLHVHGDPEDVTGRAIKAEMLEAFRPASRDWQRTVVNHGVGLVRQALPHLPGVSGWDRLG